jgi:hypothetical protein
MFNITRRGALHQNLSFTLPAGALVEGIALQESATAGTAELADGTKPIAGFSTRPAEVALPTPSIAEMLGQGSQPLEGPFLAGSDGAVEDAFEFVAEGSDYIYSGTGQVTSGTALKTKCAFKDGKVRVAQTGEYAEFMLVEKQTVEVATNNVRGRFSRIAGVIV